MLLFGEENVLVCEQCALTTLPHLALVMYTGYTLAQGDDMEEEDEASTEVIVLKIYEAWLGSDSEFWKLWAPYETRIKIAKEWIRVRKCTDVLEGAPFHPKMFGYEGHCCASISLRIGVFGSSRDSSGAPSLWQQARVEVKFSN